MIPKTAQLFGDKVRAILLDWFETEGRSFPWRRSARRHQVIEKGKVIHDPYLILVSEVMLQQTQTSRVVEKLPEFLERFPTVEGLAKGSKADLLRAWQGMGYNNRVLRLKTAAEIVVRDYGGEFPDDLKSLRSLPGIGRYTASAILCFAFGQDVPVVDVNVSRVLSRIFFKCYSTEQRLREEDLYDLDEYLLPPGDGYCWHQGIMDFGAAICRARSPSCTHCPLNTVCLSARFPVNVSLFDPGATRKSEPYFRDRPRRIWRGKIIELLRDATDGMRARDIIDKLEVGSQPFREKERFHLLTILSSLRNDGLIEVKGMIKEGELVEHDLLQLPE